MYRGNAMLQTDASARSVLGRVLTEHGFAVRVLRYLLGLPVPLPTEDRRILETAIYPYLGSLPGIASVLFVGCAWYTRQYGRTFFRSHNFWTIDCERAARKFAGKQHVVGSLGQLAEVFPEGYFDLIICNGVYGFGLDTRAQ